MTGARGRPRPDRLKVSVGYRAGHKVEAEISYSGPRADRRAALAAEVLAARLAGLPVRPRIDVLGVVPPDADERAECRVRVAALATDADVLDTVGHEVEALYTNGPAGGGGVRVFTGEVIGVVSTLGGRAGRHDPRPSRSGGRRCPSGCMSSPIAGRATRATSPLSR